MKTTTRLLAAAALTLLAGCKLDNDPIWIAMTVDKTIVTLDDSVRVTLVVTNTSDRSVMTTAESDYGRCHPGFEVADEGGRAVSMNVVCTLEARAMRPLAAGESFQVTTWWLPGISRVGNAAISPAIYTLRGAVAYDDGVVHSGSFDILVTD